MERVTDREWKALADHRGAVRMNSKSFVSPALSVAVPMTWICELGCGAMPCVPGTSVPVIVAEPAPGVICRLNPVARSVVWSKNFAAAQLSGGAGMKFTSVIMQLLAAQL